MTALTNANTNHVDQAVPQDVVMDTRQENSILTDVSLFKKAHAMMIAIHPKHAEREHQNAQKHVLIHALIMNAHQPHAATHAADADVQEDQSQLQPQ